MTVAAIAGKASGLAMALKENRRKEGEFLAPVFAGMRQMEGGGMRIRRDNVERKKLWLEKGNGGGGSSGKAFSLAMALKGNRRKEGELLAPAFASMRQMEGGRMRIRRDNGERRKLWSENGGGGKTYGLAMVLKGGWKEGSGAPSTGVGRYDEDEGRDKDQERLTVKGGSLGRKLVTSERIDGDGAATVTAAKLLALPWF